MIFTILKVIGIILLVVLALILTALLCVLFVPVKYRAVGSFDNTDIRAKAHVSWLFHLFALHIEYAQETDGYIRLAFVKKKLFDNYEALDDDDMDDAAKTETEDKVSENTGDEPKIPADESEHVADEQTEDESTSQTPNEQRSVTDENQHIKQQTKLTHQKTYKKRSEKPPKKSHKKQFKDKSDKIKNCIYKLKREYSDERNKAAFSHLKKELFIILKRICPRRLKLTMVYSTGSPDTTGISLGILACFPVGYTNRWRITPDFESEKPYAKGSFDIKGHVIVISILAATLRILFDKNCRRLYNRISREEEDIMADNSFNNTVESLFKGMDSFITTKTVVGDAIHIGDTIILPLVDVSFGVAAGAFSAEKKNNGAGGMGGKIQPSAVLVIQNGQTKLVNVKNQDGMTKILDMVPDIVSRFSKGKNDDLNLDDVKVDEAEDDKQD